MFSNHEDKLRSYLRYQKAPAPYVLQAKKSSQLYY